MKLNVYMKKALLALMIVCFIFSVVACDQDTANEEEQTTENVTAAPDETDTGAVEQGQKLEQATLEVLLPGIISTGGVSDDPITQEIARLTGVTIKLAQAEGTWTPVTTRIAANDLPDIMQINNAEHKDGLLSAGSVLALDDLIAQYGQDIQANASDMLDVSKEYYSDDSGAVYFLPIHLGPEGTITMTFAPYIRWDYFAELGYPEVKNLDQLYDVLEEMMAAHPENEFGEKNYAVGFASTYDFVYISEIGLALDSSGGGAGKALLEYYFTPKENADGETVHFRSVLDDNSSFHRSSAFYNKLYRAGMLDPDSFTQQHDQLIEKAHSGRYLYTFWNNKAGNLVFEEAGQADKGYMPMPLVKEGGVYAGTASPYGRTDRLTCITSQCEQPEAANAPLKLCI